MLGSFKFPDWKTNTPFFVEADWLHQSLGNPKIKVIDGTWTIQDTTDLLTGVIPTAQFFNLGILKDATKFGAPYPTVSTMENMAAELGIEAEDHVIIYDRQGFYSAPRLAWSFLSVGHKAVSVLRGGLPEWVAKKYETVEAHSDVIALSNYKASSPLVKGVTIDDVLEAINRDIQIIDARSEGRFFGRDPEPRLGLRSGHIPGSINLPLGIVKTDDGRLLEGQALLNVLEARNIDLHKPIITTCGSGVTAAALAFIFYALGKQDVAVYSGSWTEYGASNHPIQT